MTITLRRYADLIATTPEVPWLVQDFVPEGAIVVLVGPPASFKTFVAIALSHAVASGLDVFHRPVKQGAVLYQLGEGYAGFPSRITAWCAHHQRDEPGDVYYGQPGVAFDNKDAVDSFLAALRLQLFRPSLVVIDTYAANRSPGLDENSAQHSEFWLAGVRRVRDELGASVLILHHTGWDGDRVRGSSAIQGAADVVLLVERSGGLTARLKWAKARDFSEPAPMTLDMVESAESRVAVLSTRANALTRAQSDMLRALAESSTALRAGEWRSRSGVGKSQFHKLEKEMLNAELVARNDAGKFYPTDKGRAALYAGPIGPAADSDRTWPVTDGGRSDPVPVPIDRTIGPPPDRRTPNLNGHRRFA